MNTIKNFLFRIPSKTSNTVTNCAAWIEAIQKQQKFDENRIVFDVCHRHFKSTDFYFRNKEKVLRLNAIPNILTKTNKTYSSDIDLDNNTDNNVNNNQVDYEKKCIILQAKVAELEKVIFSMKVAHDVEVQKIKIQAKNRHRAKTNELKTAKKQLSKQQSQVIRLEDVIKELHEQHYISPEDAKSLNVIL